jgi:hypothetical protein
MGISINFFLHGFTIQNFDLVRPTLYVMVRCFVSLRISVMFGRALCGRLVFSDVIVDVC